MTLRSLTTLSLGTLALSATASAQFGGTLPTTTSKTVGAGKAELGAQNMFSTYSKAVPAHFTGSDKVDVATMMRNPSGVGHVFLLAGPGTYEYATRVDDLGKSEPPSVDIAVLPGAAPTGLDVLVDTSGWGIGAKLYDYANQEFVHLTVQGAPYQTAKWIAGGRLGGNDSLPDVVFTRSNGSNTLVTVLHDIMISAGTGGNYSLQHGTASSFSVTGEAHALCTLNFQATVPAGPVRDEIAIVTSTGTYVYTHAGALVLQLPGPVTAGDLLVPRTYGEDGGETVQSLVTLGKGANDVWYVQEHTASSTTTPVSIGALALTAAGVANLDEDGVEDLVVKSEYADVPAGFYYAPANPGDPPFLLANADWLRREGEFGAPDPDPGAACLALADFDNDGDGDILCSNPAENGWEFMRLDTFEHETMKAGLYVPDVTTQEEGCSTGTEYHYDNNSAGSGSEAGVGGHFEFQLVVPDVWPTEVDKDYARLLIKVWKLEDGSEGAESKNKGRFLYDLLSTNENTQEIMVEIDATHDLNTHPWHVAGTYDGSTWTATDDVISLEVCLVEVSPTNPAQVVAYGPSSFLMWSGDGVQPGILDETYGNLVTGSFASCFDVYDGDGQLAGVMWPHYTVCGCMIFGAPPEPL